MARRAADEQHAAAAAGVVLLALGLADALARLEPFDRQLELRIGETRPGLPRARALVVLVVRLPRDVDDVSDLTLDGLERRIEEALAQPALEFLARELDVPLPLPHLNGHATSRRRTSHPLCQSACTCG